MNSTVYCIHCTTVQLEQTDCRDEQHCVLYTLYNRTARTNRLPWWTALCTVYTVQQNINIISPSVGASGAFNNNTLSRPKCGTACACQLNVQRVCWKDCFCADSYIMHCVLCWSAVKKLLTHSLTTSCIFPGQPVLTSINLRSFVQTVCRPVEAYDFLFM